MLKRLLWSVITAVRSTSVLRLFTLQRLSVNNIGGAINHAVPTTIL